MTELPESVRRELKELLGKDEVPEDAVTIAMIVADDEKGRGHGRISSIMNKAVRDGSWDRGKKSGNRWWYWPVRNDEQEE